MTNLFEHLNVTPVINACGIYTDLGGSMLSEEIWDAMSKANECFISMPELLNQTGMRIAELMGAEAARVTPGASAAIALGVAATMTGDDGNKWEQLPDTTGLKNEALIFQSQLPRYKYASCARMCGAKLIPIGHNRGVDAKVIAEHATANTACVLVPQHLTDWYDYPPVKLKTICDAAHAVGLPVVVDAAYLNYPLDLFKSFTAAGADLVCFSAKYFYGPNAGGFAVGTSQMIGALAGLDFTGFESGQYRVFGRPFKMGRYEVIAVTLALEHWMRTDHDARFATYAKRVKTIQDALPSRRDIHGQAAFFTMDERLEPNPANCLVLRLDEGSGLAVDDVSALLESGTPSIAGIPMGDALVLAVDAMTDEHAEVVGKRLAEILSA